MKVLLLNILALALCSPAAFAQQHAAKPKLLFDGKTTHGWHTYLKPTAEPAWGVVDGALQLDPKAPGRGDLVTDAEFENFELALEWKISPGGNSGIIFGVHEDPALPNTYESGIEMQVLDNQGAEDNKKPTHLAGSLYDLQAPARDVAKPAGEWNRVRLRKQNGHLTFWLNTVKIVDVQMGSDQWKALVAGSKFKTWQHFGAYPKGHIALQDHGHEVAFRAITIQQL
ncbi:MAG: DUF1080 domain-containing protein [Hymenobacter sp.]